MMEYPFTIDIGADPVTRQECAVLMSASDPWVTLGFTEDQCLRAFDGDGKEVFVMRREGRLAGFVILQMTGTFKGYIQTLFVHASLRGQGLGSAILRFCEAHIAPVSPNVFICVSSFNEGALKLYEGSGFRKVGILNDFIRQGYDEILLRKSSGPIVTRQ